MEYKKGETIAAIATPPGEGGVAIVRISGSEALDAAQKMLSLSLQGVESHKARLTRVLNRDGETIDRALVLPMLGSSSYTGEDTVEIHCHGGALIPKMVLARALECGCRAAQPGEFTFKAYINGKIDLTQAEAVQSLIASKSERACRAAKNQLEGRLHTQITSLQKKLYDIAAILEAWVDFPEEGLEFASFESVLATLQSIEGTCSAYIASYNEGRKLHTGYTLCLLGLPNAGKSSLLNALAGYSRAIVTHIPGTTRDILEEDIVFAGYHFKLLDTAGIRSTDDIIEQEGVNRAHQAARQADIILFVLDQNTPLTQELKIILDELPKDKTVLLWNKSDIAERKQKALGFPHAISISALKGHNIETLKATVQTMLSSGAVEEKDEVLITNARHFEALNQAREALRTVIESLQTGVSAEFVTSDMRACLNALATIVGSDVSEEILNHVFSKFCVGK